jgi:23S rRNA pseudouridine1911/1915/1917 synthase
MPTTSKTKPKAIAKSLSTDSTSLIQTSSELDQEFDADSLSSSVAAPAVATVRRFAGQSDLAAVRDERLDAALAKLIPEESRARLSELIKQGKVLVDSKPAAPKLRLSGFEQIEVTLEPRPEQMAFAPEPMELQIIFEDAHVLVIDKPAGLVVHPGSGNWTGTLLNGLLAHHSGAAQLPRAGIVHRLDKDTTGVMVVAKTIEAYHSLVEQLAARTVRRTYWAVVRGHWIGHGVINQPIGRHPKDRTKMAVLPASNVGVKEAITLVSPVEYFHKHTLVQCRLKTGRTHQIRVHLAHEGFALEGDPVYAKPLQLADSKLNAALSPFLAQGRQALHAKRLQFVHPKSKKSLRFDASLPDDMAELIDDLGLHAEPYVDELPSLEAGRPTEQSFFEEFAHEFVIDDEDD